jgi:sugar phosphate isomerase/epimerase
MPGPAFIAIQLYSLRNHGPLPEQLDIVRDAGFGAVELTQGQLGEPAATQALLEARGLECPSAHVSMPWLRERLDHVIEATTRLGIGELAMPALPVEEREMDAEGWRAAGRELGGIAQRLAEHGVILAYHNHAWEMPPLADGAVPLDLLLDAGREQGLTWQADLAWVVRGGADPAATLARHGDVLASVHVKDLAPAGAAVDEDGWADVGHGTMDWADLWRRCWANKRRWMIAEHDLPSDGARFCQRSLATMARLATEQPA